MIASSVLVPATPVVDAHRTQQPCLGFADRIEKLINVERAAEGLPALATRPTLSASANRHTRDVSGKGFCAHVGSDGSGPYERMRDAD